MVLKFQLQLTTALAEINYTSQNNSSYHSFIVHNQEQELITPEENKQQHDQFIQQYAAAKWGIVDILNETYSKILQTKFDLYNWATHNTNDEVSYFLTEAGSNCMNYAQFKAPYQFHLWLGSKGFIIGIEQKGQPFPAQLIDEKNTKQNEGAAFEFYRRCKGIVFFDDAMKTKAVYFKSVF